MPIKINRLEDAGVCYCINFNDNQTWLACKKPVGKIVLNDRDYLILALCEKVLELEKQNGTIKTTQP